MAMQERTHIDLQDLLRMRHALHTIELFRTPLRHSTLLGLHRSRLRGRGMDFDQVRAYQIGDDARTIDWRVTARTGEVHSKVFHEERERSTLILIEQSLHLFFASAGCFKSVLAAQVASLFAWTSLHHNDRVGGLVFDHAETQYIPAQRNKQGVLRLLQAIADANQRLQQPMAHQLNNPLVHALQHAQRLIPRGSLLVLICNERHLNDTTRPLISRLAERSELILLPLSDPLEHNLPNIGQAQFSRGPTSISINTADPTLRQQWQDTGAAYQAAWRNLAQQLNAPLLPLSTQHPILQQLQNIRLQQSSGTP